MAFLNLTENGTEIEEVNAVDVVQEIVAIAVVSEAAKSVSPIRQKGITRRNAAKTVRLAVANGSRIRVEGDARLEFVRDGKKCNMKSLDADVKRPAASVSAIVDEGNVFVFGPQESYNESTCTGQRVPMSRRKGVFVVQLDAQGGSRTTKNVRFDEPNTNEMTPVFRRPAWTRMWKKFVSAVGPEQTGKQKKKEVFVTRIEEVDDVENEKAEAEQAGGRGRFGAKGRLTNRWISGSWWGRDASSDEHLVGTKHALLKYRSVRRKPPGEQWSRRETIEARGTKWNFDVEMDSGIPGLTLEPRRDEGMPTADGNSYSTSTCTSARRIHT